MVDGVEDRDVVLPERRRTRFGGTKHVKVYGATLNSRKNKTKKIEGILKPTTYQFHKNFIPEQLRVLNKEYFYARKDALINHSEICDMPKCVICDCSKAVSSYRYDPGNYSRYVFQKYPQQAAKSNKPLKTVRFTKDTVFQNEKTFRSLHLNEKLVTNACLYNISFTEANILERK